MDFQYHYSGHLKVSRPRRGIRRKARPTWGKRPSRPAAGGKQNLPRNHDSIYGAGSQIRKRAAIQEMKIWPEIKGLAGISITLNAREWCRGTDEVVKNSRAPGLGDRETLLRLVGCDRVLSSALKVPLL